MSEKKLWNDLRNGDKRALEIIYTTYFSELYRYGRRFSIDESTVEDCIQELFIEIWNRRERLSETDAIKPYLFISLKRNIIRSTKKIRKITDVEIQEYHFEAELAIDQILIQAEISEAQKNTLQVAFAELSTRQKEILYLKYYAELEYEEITEIMDLNYQSARNLVSRALAKLGKHMSLFVSLLLAKDMLGAV